jgi:phospholipid transport system substrate-binding protein
VVQAVRNLNKGLQEVLLAANELDYAARYQRLAPLLSEAFDFQFMARQAIGQEWEKLTPEQQRAWTETFRDLSTATYANRFDRANGQSFETLGAEPAPHDTVLVHSRVLEPGKEAVDLSYRLRQSGGRWQVIDVLLKGKVSELALRRSEYSAVLKREGFDALLSAARRKMDQLATGPARP